MKRYGTFIALGLAVLFGVAAVYMTNIWLSSKTVTEGAVVLKEQISVSEIVVASVGIPVGSRLNETNLTLASWPEENVPKGAFTDMTALADRIAVSKLVAGEPLLAAELAAPGSGAGLVAMIEPGMRAMSIKVDEVTGVGTAPVKDSSRRWLPQLKKWVPGGKPFRRRASDFLRSGRIKGASSSTRPTLL